MGGGTNRQILELMGRFLHSKAGEESRVGCGTSNWKTSVLPVDQLTSCLPSSGCWRANGSLPSFSTCFVDLWIFEVEDLCPRKDTVGSRSTAGLNWIQILLTTLNLVFCFCWAEHLFPSAVMTSILTHSPQVPVYMKCEHCGYKP